MSTIFEEKEKKLFLLFKEAVESERKAQKMYKEMIENCSEPELIDILEGFFQDEVRHEQEIIKKYNELKTKLKVED